MGSRVKTVSKYVKANDVGGRRSLEWTYIGGGALRIYVLVK